MNIVFSANSGWNIYNFRLNLVKKLLEEKHNIIIVSPFDSCVEKLIELGCKYVSLEFNSKSLSVFSNLILIIKYYQIFKKYNVNVYFGFTIKPNIFGSLVTRVCRISTINNITGLGTTFLRSNFLEFFVKILYKFSLKKSKIVFFHNIDDQKLFIKNKIVKSNQTEILPGSGIDLNFFINNNTNNRRSEDLIFLYFGRVIRDKGINEFLESAKIVKDFFPSIQFNILGPLEKNATMIKKKINDYHNQQIINYLGTTYDVRPFINRVDCVILPSYREGLPRSILEAFALSKPVISTNVPGCKDIVIDGINGLLCTSQDIKSLTDTIIKFIKLPISLRNSFGKAGRKLVENKYDEKVVIKAYLNCLSKFSS